MINRSYLAAFVLLTFSIDLFAFRPFVNDDAGTVPQGTFELEFAGDYADEKGSIGLCFGHGITERMDLSISLGNCIHPFHERTFNNAELGLKFALLPDLLSASFTGSFADPAYSSALILSRSIGLLSFHSNLGFTATANTDDVNLTYGLAAVIQKGRLSTGAEFAGSQHAIDWWQVALLFSVADWLILDAGVGGGFDQMSSIQITSGLLFAFPLKTGN